MFRWVKSLSRKSEPIGEGAVLDALIKPQASAIAITRVVRAYFEDVEAGRITPPAIRWKNAGVLGIWKATRLEAMRPFFGFGKSDFLLLAKHTSQVDLLGKFLDEKVHLEFPQPRGEPVTDTVQALWQIYVYLDSIGSEVCDRETDRQSLRSSGKTILSNLEIRSRIIRERWLEIQSSVGSKSPRTDIASLFASTSTLLDELWLDVTAKSKSIAFSATFGPSYEDGIESLISSLSDRLSEDEVNDFRGSVQRMLSIDEPDLYEPVTR